MRNLLLFFFSMLLFSCKEDKEILSPEITDLNESVYATGTVRPLNEYKVFSAAPGIIRKKLITEGQLVQVGQPLFIIENKNPEINVQNALLALDLAKENYQGASGKLKELQLSVQLAKEKLSLDSLMFMRQKDLWKQGIGTQNDYDQKQLAYTAAQNNYQSALSKYEQLAVQLNNEVKRAENNFRLAQSTRGDYEIKSELAGKVYEVLKEPGEQGNLQEPLAIIGDSSSFIIELQIDEYDISRVNIGQQIFVKMDSYKDQIFEATVSRIYPSMNERTRSFKVDAVFTKAPPKLYPHLSAEVNIIIQSKKNVLTIPREYLSEDHSVTLEDGKKVKVETGVSDLEKVEIISGIDKNARLIKP